MEVGDGDPTETPATESPQIIIPVRDAMPAGLSKVPSWFVCGTLAVQAHFEGELGTGVFLD